jgi:hypothetical protein
MELEESIKRLESGINALKRRANDRDEAFREGFLRGIWCALLLAQGKNPPPPVELPRGSRKREPASPVKESQLDLF